MSSMAERNPKRPAEPQDEQKKRHKPEDVWVIKDGCDDADGSSNSTRVAFYGVFDGHGGRSCAEWVAERLHEAVCSCGLVPEQVAAGKAELDLKAARKAIIQGFEQLDAQLLEHCQQHSWHDGCTAVAAWAIGDQLFVANVGDAKCVLARRSQEELGAAAKAIVLTKEHKALLAGERTRIERAGGFVAADGRLGGRLEVSRAFGDRQHKQSGLSATPDIQTFKLISRDEFLVLACDGFWGVFSAGEAVESIRSSLQDGTRSLKQACNRTLYQAIRERRCKDNCTLLVVRFMHGKTDPGQG